MKLQINIRYGKKEDLPEMQKLFVETIRAVCAKDYDEFQINVWISGANNSQRWIDIMNQQLVFIAELNEKIVGFSTLKNFEYIDLLYVDKDFQKQGVALNLFNVMEKTVIQNKRTELTSDVSITAKPFFEKIGFKTIEKQTVIRDNIGLLNYKMVKSL
jgi:putative acetyltransferase